MKLTDRLGAFLEECEREQELERKVEDLRRRVEDLEDWLGSVAEDMLNQTGPLGRRIEGEEGPNDQTPQSGLLRLLRKK